MNANDVIESYVTDVALRLPRKQRNDVAFELRALLNEELQARAEDAGRAADADMAIGLVNAFGEPGEVAGRYRPAVTIIDPAQGQAFVRLTVIGLLVIWCLGAFEVMQQPLDPAGGVMRAIGQWWGGAVIPSLWWPGLLVVSYGLASWARARKPRAAAWKPRDGDAIPAGRVALAIGVLGIACGLWILLDPRWVLDFFFAGKAAPAAYQALTYTDTFLQRQAPWLFLCLLLNIPLLAMVIVRGRWSATLRRIETALSLVTYALMVWVALDGPVFKADSSDQMVKSILWLIVAITLIAYGIKAYRRVTPAPN